MDIKRGIRVLLVDDDKLVRDVVAEMLQRNGYIVVAQAQDGLEAIEKNELIQPDIIIMDIEMPNLNGLEASERIQKTFPKPIVALTSHESVDFVQRASEVGIGAYLVKPPRCEELLRAIVIALARYEDFIKLKRKYSELQEQELRQRQAVHQIRQRLSDELDQVNTVLSEAKESEAPNLTNVIYKGCLKVDLDSFSLMIDGTPVELSQTEFTIILHLVMQSPRIVAPEELYLRVQPENTELWDPSEVIRYNIYRIRKKIKESGIKKDIIRNVRSVGYAIDV